MKVIIVGAGEVGRVSAETISNVHDVLVIERDETVLNVLKSRLNVSTLKADGTNPKTIQYAIENHDADMIIATLGSDSENLFLCLMAKRFKPSIITVSSVNNPDYMIQTSDQGVEGVDTIISPELITAQKMYKLCILENAIDYESMANMGTSVAMFTIEPQHDIVGKVVMHLKMPDDCTVFAIYRDEVMHTEVETMEIHPGDKICVFGTDEALKGFNELMGVEYPAKNFVILGGSIVGRNLARLLAADKLNVKIIERDEALCRDMARSLTGVAIACADFIDPDVQNNESIFRSDALITTSHADDTNLLMSMTAQRHNSRKVITRYFTKEYEDIFQYTGIETIIGYYRIISNEITKSTISDETAIMTARDQDEFYFVHMVDQQSKLLDRYLGDMMVPEGVRIVAVKRGDGIVYPRLDTRFQKDDAVIVFTSFSKRTDLIRVFGKSSIPEV